MAKCWAPYTCLLSCLTWAQLKVQHAVKEVCYVIELPWGSVWSNLVAPVYFLPPRAPWFWAFSKCMCRAKAAAIGNEEVGLLGELISAQHAIIFLPDPRFMVYCPYLFTLILFITCQVLPRITVHVDSRSEVIAGCRVACWLGTGRFNYWQSTAWSLPLILFSLLSLILFLPFLFFSSSPLPFFFFFFFPSYLLYGHVHFLLLFIVLVRYHCGGWPEEVNSCFLNSYMVYL